ncbi:MAG: DUF2934 domain-containing protein [Candidatus Dormibacteraceae bacterium]
MNDQDGTTTRRTGRTATGPSSTTAPSRVGDPTAAAPTQERIAQRAYERFVARGCEHGHDEEDWLQAELELKSGRN